MLSFRTSLSRSSRFLIPRRASHGKCLFSTATSSNETTVNDDEIAHFSKLSALWWEEQGEFAFLHMMNPPRMQFICDKLLEAARDDDVDTDLQEEDVLKGLDVLDVGCGGGLLSESLARMGGKTLGIDASKSNIAIAQSHASYDPKLSPSSGNSLLSYQYTTAESMLESTQRYDVVCSMEVLEHVDNPSAFLKTCAELVKPGGHLFLSTVARTPLAYFLTILMAEDVLRKVSKGTHTYSKFVKPSELVDFFRGYRSPGTAGSASPTPWISTPSTSNYLTRTEAELRGLIFNPFQMRWHLAPRGAWGSLENSYLFWVRKPKI